MNWIFIWSEMSWEVLILLFHANFHNLSKSKGNIVHSKKYCTKSETSRWRMFWRFPWDHKRAPLDQNHFIYVSPENRRVSNWSQLVEWEKGGLNSRGRLVPTSEFYFYSLTQKHRYQNEYQRRKLSKYVSNWISMQLKQSGPQYWWISGKLCCELSEKFLIEGTVYNSKNPQ